MERNDDVCDKLSRIQDVYVTGLQWSMFLLTDKL